MNRLSLHAKLAFGILTISVLPLLLAVALIPKQVGQILHRQSESRLQAVAANLAALTHETFVRHIEGVRLLSTQSELIEALRAARMEGLGVGQKEGLRIHFARLLRHFDVFHHGLFLFDANGATVASALGHPHGPPPTQTTVADREYFQRARATHQPVVSHPIASRISGVPIIVVGAPILEHDGEFLGLIAVAIELEHFDRILGADTREGPSIMAVSSDGRVAYHADHTRLLEPYSLQTPSTGGHASATFNSQLTPATDDADQVYAYAHAPAAEWTMVVSQGADLLFQEVRSVRRFLLILLAVCILGTLAVAFGFSHLVTHPLAQMIATVQRAGATVMHGADQIVAHAEKLSVTAHRQAKGIGLTNEVILDLDKSIRGNSLRSQAAAAITRSAQERQRTSASPTSAVAQQVHQLVAEIADGCQEQAEASARVTRTLRDIDASLLVSTTLADESASVARKIKEEVLGLTTESGQLHAIVLGLPGAAPLRPTQSFTLLTDKPEFP